MLGASKWENLESRGTSLLSSSLPCLLLHWVSVPKFMLSLLSQVLCALLVPQEEMEAQKSVSHWAVELVFLVHSNTTEESQTVATRSPVGRSNFPDLTMRKLSPREAKPLPKDAQLVCG